MRPRHYSICTETAYVDWARRFILFHGKRHPQEMGEVEVVAFLTHLAVERQAPASTQNEAKAAILYLYEQVLGAHLPHALAVKYPQPARDICRGWPSPFNSPHQPAA